MAKKSSSKGRVGIAKGIGRVLAPTASAGKVAPPAKSPGASPTARKP
jgi:hypothetical protein